MTDYSYSVGFLMFATLYGLLGEPDFNRLVGGFYQGAQAGGTRDFVAHAKRSVGRDLATVFDDWLFTTRWTGIVRTATSVRDLTAPYR